MSKIQRRPRFFAVDEELGCFEKDSKGFFFSKVSKNSGASEKV